jgi:predicted enzyme related to lactoylglutathione lyase
VTKYVHTNIVAHDWRSLAAFYERALDGEVLTPFAEARPWLGAGIGVPGASLEGVHVRLPGHGPTGPTLEIYSLTPLAEVVAGPGLGPGYRHLAFRVDDVDDAVAAILDAGGSLVGEVVEADVEGMGRLRMVYARDPEGNVLEIQSVG